MFEFMLLLAIAGFMFELTFVIVEVLVAPVLALTDVVVVVVVVVVLAFMAIFRLPFAAVFVFAASPQAIPKAPRAKSVESAIIFFMSKLILLSSSKIKVTLFLP